MGKTSEPVGEALQALKRQGASVLLAGVGPAHAFDTLSAYHLGTAAHDVPRERFFLLFGRPDTVAEDRLDCIDDDATLEDAEIIYSTSNRSTVTYPANHTTGFGWSTQPKPTGGLLDQLVDAVHATTTSDYTDSDLTPGQYRLCVDSLTPLLDLYGTDDTRTFLDAVHQAVYAVNGLAHAILPLACNDPAVHALRESFDVFVPIRVEDGTAKYRFELQDRGRVPPVQDGMTTDWHPVEALL